MGLADVIVIVILVLIPTAIGFIKPSRGCHGCGGNCGECSKCLCCERKNDK